MTICVRQPPAVNYAVRMKAFAIVVAMVGIFGAVAVWAPLRDRWQFYRKTGVFAPQQIVETLQSPVHIDKVTEKGFSLQMENFWSCRALQIG